MNPQTSSLASSGASSVASRHEMCRHFTARGRKCRLRALRAGLCFRHAALQVQPAQAVDVDLSAEFLVQLDDLQSADQINQFLAKLLILVVQNRISPPSRRSPHLHHQPTPPFPRRHQAPARQRSRFELGWLSLSRLQTEPQPHAN
jgi:hypothetical protein